MKSFLSGAPLLPLPPYTWLMTMSAEAVLLERPASSAPMSANASSPTAECTGSRRSFIPAPPHATKYLTLSKAYPQIDGSVQHYCRVSQRGKSRSG